MPMRVLCDTGPLLSAIDSRDPAHRLSTALISTLGRGLHVPVSVAVEVDYLVRKNVGESAARVFLETLRSGTISVAYMTPGLLRRAVEIDAQYADLRLGLTDACVMSYAERYDMPVLTFDFRAFRATRPASGYWKLVVDEGRYAEAVGA